MTTQRNKITSRHWVEYLPFYFLFSDNVFDEELKKRRQNNGFSTDAKNIKSDFTRSISTFESQLKQIEHG
jgi:hypothetical protein